MRLSRSQARGLANLAACASLCLALLSACSIAYAQEDLLMTQDASAVVQVVASVSEAEVQPAGFTGETQDVPASLTNDAAVVDELAAVQEGAESEDIASPTDAPEGPESSNDAAQDEDIALGVSLVQDETGEAPDEDATGDVASSSSTGSLDASASDQPLEAASDAPKNGWYTPDEGESFFYYTNGSPVSGWLVTGTAPDGSVIGLQRYWLGDGGVLARSRLVSPKEGNGAWWAYARPEGYVVRGSYRDGDTVYLADDDGRMPSGAGWLVTQAYGHGLQRYYLEQVEPSVYAAKVGPSTKGWAHYTRPEGYVVRGSYRDGDTVYLANNDGRVPKSEGWVVTSAYGHGLQRYYLEATQVEGISAAQVGASTKGWAHYTRPEGYVVRGRYRADDVVYLANNDGRLPSRTGWLVTSAYGDGLQRYYLERVGAKGINAARVGASSKGWAHYTLPAGYVLRGAHKDGDYLYVADNDGRLPVLAADAKGNYPSKGWLVTNKMTGSYERYYLYAVAEGIYAARPGASTDGWAHFTRPEGYVVRGSYLSGKNVYLANNDGRMPNHEGWLVSKAYGHDIQRYYLYKIKSGIFAARTGLSTDGYLHYTNNDGYVLRNGLRLLEGKWYKADNDGLLVETVPVDIIQSIRGSLCHGPKGAEFQRYIVLHDTEGGGNAWNIIDGWEAAGSYVASHFIVNRDGSIVQCVPMDQIAHHAGFGDTGHNAYYGISESSRDDWRGTQRIGSWASDYGMNAWSIGIEMVHEGYQSYPTAQLVALDRLIAYIDGYYGFQSTIIDHKMWRSYNSDTSDVFAGYLDNYRRTRTHDGMPL